MRKEPVEVLREAIKAAVAKGGTYRSIGEAAGVDPAAINRFVNGKRSIDVVIAFKLLDILGLEIRQKPKSRRRKGSK
jgi:transcriptional regulator with XRE-family HTH domain